MCPALWPDSSLYDSFRNSPEGLRCCILCKHAVVLHFFPLPNVEYSSPMSKPVRAGVGGVVINKLWNPEDACLAPESCLRTCLALPPMDCHLPGSSVHGISQTRTLEQVSISFSTGSFQPRDWTCVSCTGRWVLYHLSPWEASPIVFG